MTALKTRFLSLSILLSLSVAPQALFASDKNTSNDLSGYVDLDKIAIDPVLLNTKDLDEEIVPPTSENIKLLEMSPLEELYSERLRENILQFGYDLFPVTPASPSGAPSKIVIF